MDKDEFWATKSPLPEYHAVTFEHAAFAAPIRLVANVFAEVTLSGNVHTPAPMQIKPPETSSDGSPKLTLMFPRQVVGRQFKQQLALIVAAGSRDPIEVTYSVYTGDTAAPAVTWALFASDAGGVSFSTDTVQISAGLDNPMQRAVAPVYLPETFTGLSAF
jgi:hypothetical protein